MKAKVSLEKMIEPHDLVNYLGLEPALHWQNVKVLPLDNRCQNCDGLLKNVRHCGLVVSAPAWDGTGCEFDSRPCRIYIPCSLSLRLLGSLRGSLGTYGLTQKLC